MDRNRSVSINPREHLCDEPCCKGRRPERTLRDLEHTIDTLKKENFNLKLQIYQEAELRRRSKTPVPSFTESSVQDDKLDIALAKLKTSKKEITRLKQKISSLRDSQESNRSVLRDAALMISGMHIENSKRITLIQGMEELLRAYQLYLVPPIWSKNLKTEPKT